MTTLPKHAKHRRDVGLPIIDPPSNARCTGTGLGGCTAVYCPRHQPTNYADAMARHATDSI